VSFADQGQVGFAKVKQALADGLPYAMAFVDMRMPPGWDGVETIEHLWQVDPDLQVVICTAFSDHAWEQVIQRLGQSDRLLILRKPFDSIEAWQLANALTAKWSLQRQARARRDELEAEVAQRTEALQKETAARQRAEQHALQSQKMEAIGRLAGGVAHDFNNLLTVISCSSEMLMMSDAVKGFAGENVKQIKKAADRAAALTRQLLSFSRKEIVSPVVLSLNTVVGDSEKMFSRIVRENIRLDVKLSPALRFVKADPSQMEQVLMNLVVNASDAMPNGGELCIETTNADVDTAFVQSNPSARNGTFVKLIVRDTGCGMDEHTQARLFEPFFTTKERGKGTGLGLATVFGIIQEAGGWIEVESAPGRGSAFTVYLPQCVADPLSKCFAQPDSATAATEFQRHNETVLLVEDDDDVRDMTKTVLTNAGYKVLTAADGPKAIALAEKHSDKIDILVTDLIMPGMNGRQVSDQIVAMKPGIRVLLISGYTEDEQVRHGVRESVRQFLQKPFTPSALQHKLQEVLA
jgi:signal transduction histidine kinase